MEPRKSIIWGYMLRKEGPSTSDCQGGECAAASLDVLAREGGMEGAPHPGPWPGSLLPQRKGTETWWWHWLCLLLSLSFG